MPWLSKPCLKNWPHQSLSSSVMAKGSNVSRLPRALAADTPWVAHNVNHWLSCWRADITGISARQLMSRPSLGTGSRRRKCRRRRTCEELVRAPKPGAHKAYTVSLVAVGRLPSTPWSVVVVLGALGISCRRFTLSSVESRPRFTLSSAEVISLEVSHRRFTRASDG